MTLETVRSELRELFVSFGELAEHLTPVEIQEVTLGLRDLVDPIRQRARSGAY
jgi:hypothetical protein